MEFIGFRTFEFVEVIIHEQNKKNALNKQNNCSVILNHIIKEQVNANLSIIVLLLNADSGSNNILIQVCTFEEPYT